MIRQKSDNRRCRMQTRGHDSPSTEIYYRFSAKESNIATCVKRRYQAMTDAVTLRTLKATGTRWIESLGIALIRNLTAMTAKRELLDEICDHFAGMNELHFYLTFGRHGGDATD